jgi:hypothetical protein
MEVSTDSNKIEFDDAYLLNLTSSLDEEIIKKGFAVISDSKIKKLAENARVEYYRNFTALSLNPQSIKFNYMDVEKKPIRKLAIGASNGVGDPYAQFLQSTYFSIESLELQSLSQLAKTMIHLRNQLSDLPLDFGENPVKDKFWNASRVHHYPSGGGFMSRHYDTYFPKIMQSKKIPFLQLILLLSKKGKDFYTGGGFIIPKGSDKLINLEDEYSFGDIIVFDGTMVHGVDTVDSHVIPDLNSKNGRLSFIVGLYEVQKN